MVFESASEQTEVHDARRFSEMQSRKLPPSLYNRQARSMNS